MRVAAHLQLAVLEADRLPPLVLPVEVEQWVESELTAVETAAPPALPAALLAAARPQQKQHQRGSGPSVLQKRKWQAGSPPSAAGGPATESAAPTRTWAAVVAGRSPSSSAAAALQQSAVPVISKLPFWKHMTEQMAAEQQREQGLQEHAVLAATDMLPPDGQPVPSSGIAHGDFIHYSLVAAVTASAGGGAGAPGNGRLSLLQRLRQEAMAEQEATERLVQTALV